MKVYVSVDMEGLGGIALKQQLVPGELLYEEARELLTEEVNAWVTSLRSTGARHIVVKDAHGTGFNLKMQNLTGDADYVVGPAPITRRFPGLDSSFDAALLVGYHAMGGTSHAIRDHTMTSDGWQYLELNGQPIGEIALDALLFGLYDVPVAMVSGDDKACSEARKSLDHVTTFESKQSFGKHIGLLKAPVSVRSEIPQVVEQSLKNISNCRPYTMEGPYRMKVHFNSTEQADSRSFDGTNSVRTSGLCAEYFGNNLTDVLSRAFSG